MTDEIKWGAEIALEEIKALGLDGGERVDARFATGGWRHSGMGCRADCLSWECYDAFRLPADHPYYTRSDDTPVTITPMTVEEATAALYNIPTLRALGLIREETTLERFEKAYGFMTTRERDTVAAFIEWQDSFSA